jgi:hypothetical protein
MGAVGRGAVGARFAGAGSLTASRTAAAAHVSGVASARMLAATRARGLGGLLDEFAVTRPVVDVTGRIAIGRSTVAVIDNAGAIRLASTGEMLGRIDGTLLYAARSSTAAGTAIGEVLGSASSGRTLLAVTRVRTGWYRVTLRPIPEAGGGLAVGAAGLGLVAAADDEVAPQRNVPDYGAVTRAADAAAERRVRAGIRERSTRSRVPSTDSSLTKLRADIERVLRHD